MYQGLSKLIERGPRPSSRAEPRAVLASTDVLSAAAPNTRFSPPMAADALLAEFAARDLLLLSEEAVHRTKNLAQLANAVVCLRLVTGKKLVGAKHLALAYAEVGETGNGDAPMPCADLLQRVVSGLGALFQSAGRDVSLDVEAMDIVLTPDRRRALVLIASELVINALRHAFPGKRPGSIFVSLRSDGKEAILAVEDDGVGLTGDPSGQGSRILAGLTAMLGGTLSRGPSTAGGLGVYVLFRTNGYE